jgi:ketopantoate reductase
MANQQKVAVLGAGVMGEALIAALIGSGVKSSSIAIVEKRPERCSELVDKYAITVESLHSAVSTSNVILLVVKPQDMQGLLTEIKADINKDALVLSFVAGKKIGYIHENLSDSQPIVRIMPNTPTSVGLGAAGYSFGSAVTQEHRGFVSSLLAAAGKAVEVDESLQDALTSLPLLRRWLKAQLPLDFHVRMQQHLRSKRSLALLHCLNTRVIRQRLCVRKLQALTAQPLLPWLRLVMIISLKLLLAR